METLNKIQVPLICTRNMVVFPGISFPMRIARPESVTALLEAQGRDGVFLTLLQKTNSSEINSHDLETVGTLCKIEHVKGSRKDGYQILARGLSRFEAKEVINLDKNGERYLVAEGSELKDEAISDLGEGAKKVSEHELLLSLKELAKEILSLVPADTRDMVTLLDGVEDLSFLIWLCAANVDLPVVDRQALLSLGSLTARAKRISDCLTKFRDELQVRSEIRDRLTNKIGKTQREAILREQLKAIREELGESEGGSGKDDYSQKLAAADFPDYVRKVAEEEIKRLEALGNHSPESHVIRNYLDLIFALPWTKSASPQIDLEEARKVLDAEHFGLESVKKRILQQLAVMKMKGAQRGSILLLLGPPGVGKTSLGQSIAKALGRKFVRASLGGVRDESEIRGHRRTYIGALPGRIIQGIKRAGENNPVFILDEIDKMGRGFQGDPAGAMLEVLDPEQNNTFLDHYLDLNFDLSKVFFIATANSLEGIPGPLLDRMEIIELSGYTSAEKLHIAKRHLVPKQLEENGLNAEQWNISDEALLRVITHYTREAGVRDLQRKIATLCRVSVERVLNLKAGESLRIGIEELDEALGSERFTPEAINRVAPPGVVTGLAWTPMGGEILLIESSLMEGTGQLTLTGQLGDVMKESAQIARSLVRAKLPHLVASLNFAKKDLHLHVPAGGIPKDGPSAGITLLAAIASLFTGRSVSPKLAMTGEITLRGAVLPVGGIKEKVLGAHRAGIERVIMSVRNKKDLKEVPEEVKAQMKFDFVDSVEEVLGIALGLEPGSILTQIDHLPVETLGTEASSSMHLS